MDWWLIALIFIQLSFVAFLLWLVASYRQRSLDRRSQERLRVLERFDSSEELSSFLARERGSSLLGVLVPRGASPWRPVITGLVAGLVLLFVGCGFFVLTAADVWNDHEFFLIPAVLTSSAGLGLLVATAVATGLARARGLLTREPLSFNGEES